MLGLAVLSMLALTLALVLASCAGDPSTVAAAQYAAVVQSNVAYGPLPEETLDLCRPRDATGPRPGVILIHGGGWSSGDKSEYAGLCRRLATYGYMAATINYRLTPKHIWPTQLVDAQLAVRSLRANAITYGLDPRRLCSWGFSAGGHLAVFLGVLRTIHPGDQTALYADQSPAVSCVVDEFGPVDLLSLQPTAFHSQILRGLFGGAPASEDAAAYRDASPTFDVTAHSAPTLIVQGTQDQLVEAAQSRELWTLLQHAGVPTEYISFDGGHMFSGLSQQQQADITLQEIAFVAQHSQP
jgi:acetyl esterase/lipase